LNNVRTPPALSFRGPPLLYSVFPPSSASKTPSTKEPGCCAFRNTSRSFWRVLRDPV
jgi:hypothetical protein